MAVWWHGNSSQRPLAGFIPGSEGAAWWRAPVLHQRVRAAGARWPAAWLPWPASRMPHTKHMRTVHKGPLRRCGSKHSCRSKEDVRHEVRQGEGGRRRRHITTSRISMVLEGRLGCGLPT